MSRIDELIAEHCPDGVEFRPLGQLGRRNKGTPITAGRMKEIQAANGPVRVFAGGNTMADVEEKSIPAGHIIRDPSIIVKSRGHIGFTFYDRPFTHKNELWSYTINRPDVDQKFIYYYLLTRIEHLQALARATSVKLPQLGVADTDRLPVPVPPIEVQREIVRILDTFTQLEAELEAELEARRIQYAHYREQLLKTSSGLGKVMNLGEIGAIVTGRTPKTSDTEAWGDHMDFVTPSDISNGMKHVSSPKRRLSPSGANALARIVIPARSVLVTCIGADMGKTVINAHECVTNQQINTLIPKSGYDSDFLFHTLSSRRRALLEQGERSGGTLPIINKSDFANIEISIPPLSIQQRVSVQLNEFDALTNDLSVGLPAELEARRKQYAYYRDKLLTFKELPA